MSICSTSPGQAPSTATAPVRICGPKGRPFCAAWIACSSGGTWNPAGGSVSTVPLTDSIVTLSPLAMVRAGGTRASK